MAHHGKEWMNARSIPRQTGDYRLEDFGAELVLYDIATTQVVYLNAAAALIWRLVDGNRSVADIRTLLADAYPDGSTQIEDDVEEALIRLVDCGAVELI